MQCNASFQVVGKAPQVRDVTYMVLKVFEVAAVVWPLKLQGKFWTFDLSITELSWVVVLSTQFLYVVPSAVMSPCQIIRKGIKQGATSYLFMVTGAEVSLPEYQASVGFTGVGEHVLTLLCEENQIPTPDGALTGKSYQAQLAMSLMFHYMPSMTESSAMAALLSKGTNNPVPKEDYLDDFDEGMVADVVLAGDQKLAKAFLTDRDKVKVKRQTKVKEVQEIVEQCFKVRANCACCDHLKAPAPKLKAKASAGAAQARIYANIEEKYRVEVMTNIPPGGSCVCDDENGRFKISYGTNSKSVSWTHRGQQACVQIALATLWTWHNAATGQVCPDHLRGYMA
eukprot:6492303-Amphidinium_carterae.1